MFSDPGFGIGIVIGIVIGVGALSIIAVIALLICRFRLNNRFARIEAYFVLFLPYK